MTYIAAFPCSGGIVMCADTLESFADDHKEYVEKLDVSSKFPISIGGAGVGEIIEAMSQEIIDGSEKAKPKTRAALRQLIVQALAKVYRDDVPTLVLEKQARSPELLIAAKPKKDDPCIFRTRGPRVFDVPKCRIIGWGTKYNKELLSRLFREKLTMLQGVILATYLVSQSKLMDGPVGGETRVTVVTPRGAFQEKSAYISYLETRANEFIKQTDILFLACLDTSLGEKQLREHIDAFTNDALGRYRKHVDSTLERLSMKEVFEYHPYQKSPLNTAITFGPGGFKAQHDPAENERVGREFREARTYAESMIKQLKPRKSKDQP